MVPVELPAALDHVLRGTGAVDGRHAAFLREIHSACAAAGGFLGTEDYPFRMALVASLHVVLNNVVVSLHLKSFDERGAACVRRSGLAGRIQQVYIVLHLLHYGSAGGIVLQAPLLVTHAPENHAGMAAAEAHHILQQALVLRVDTHKAIFVDHHHAQAVADVQEGRGGGIVGAADGVYAQFLKLLHAPLDEAVRHRAARSGVVLVKVYALENHLAAVEHKAFIGIEFSTPQAHFGVVCVDGEFHDGDIIPAGAVAIRDEDVAGRCRLAGWRFGIDRCFQRVQERVVHIPEMGETHFEVGAERGGLAGLQVGVSLPGCYLTAFRVEETVHRFAFRVLMGGVLQLGEYRQDTIVPDSINAALGGVHG